MAIEVGDCAIHIEVDCFGHNIQFLSFFFIITYGAEFVNPFLWLRC